MHGSMNIKQIIWMCFLRAIRVLPYLSSCKKTDYLTYLVVWNEQVSFRLPFVPSSFYERLEPTTESNSDNSAQLVRKFYPFYGPLRFITTTACTESVKTKYCSPMGSTLLCIVESRSLTLRLLMSYIYIYIYIYGAPILDVSRSHTTTHHSR